MNTATVTSDFNTAFATYFSETLSCNQESVDQDMIEECFPTASSKMPVYFLRNGKLTGFMLTMGDNSTDKAYHFSVDFRIDIQSKRSFFFPKGGLSINRAVINGTPIITATVTNDWYANLLNTKIKETGLSIKNTMSAGKLALQRLKAK